MKDILVHHSLTVGTPIGYSDQLLALTDHFLAFDNKISQIFVFRNTLQRLLNL